MAGSVYAAPFLIGGLFRAQSGQAALDLLRGSGLASWMNMIRLGAGATAEAWDPSLKSNLTYSHPWAASPTFLLPSGLFGISPLEPGYASVRIQPQPGNLHHASLTLPSVRGPIGVAFNHDTQGRFRLAVQVPGNTRAEVQVPVPEGTDTSYVDQVPRAARAERGYAALTALGAGCHVVSLAAPGDADRDEFLRAVCRTPPALGGAEPGAGTPPLVFCSKEAGAGVAY